MTTLPVARRAVLADLVPHARASAPVADRRAGATSVAVNLLLILTGTALVAVLAQVAIPLPFTPVPLTLGTFGALVVGAGLGPARATASLALYVLAGIAGVGWFAGGAHGWQFASFGYLLGFVVAAAVTGRFARRGADRSVGATVGIMLVGSAVVYAFGVPWLAIFLGVDLGTALTLGVVPFLIGDAIKAVLAALLLPGLWRVLGRVER